MHRLSDTICIENGYFIVADPKQHGKSYNKWLGDRAKPSQRDAIRELIDHALEQKPADVDALLELLKAAGCQIKYGKQISICGPGQKRYKRLDTLGEAYDLPALKAILAGERKYIPGRQRQMRADTEPKVNLLIDIQAVLRAGKGSGYERWAKCFNIKQIAQTLNYPRENSILDYDELLKRVDQIKTRCDELAELIKDMEAKLAANATLQTHILNYIKTRDVYVAYRESGYSKRFLSEHEGEIALHKAAKKAFDELGLKKLPTIRSLRAEYAALLGEKKRGYAEYRRVRDDMRQAVRVKANIDYLVIGNPIECEVYDQMRVEQAHRK